MRNWLMAWWQAITRAPHADPWRDDPRIRAERMGQHARVNKATALSGWDQMAEQQRQQDIASAEVEARSRALKLSEGHER
jgi:hypothetical protein